MFEQAEPLVSIIVPSFNHAQYIVESINSALDQSYSNIEVVVVDDGSSDDTHEVLKREFSGNPKVILVLNTENRGQSAVMNQGLAISKGEYINPLASDDWLLPDKISLQLARFNECGASVGVVYGLGYRYYEDTQEMSLVNYPLFRGDILPVLAERGNFIFPMSPLFKREVFDKVPFDESYTAQGEAIYQYIALYYKFDYVDQPVAVMRDHSYNTGKDVYMLFEEVERDITAFFSDDRLPNKVKKLEKRRRARFYRTKGLQFVGDHSDFKKGRDTLLKAIKNRPEKVADIKLILALLVTILPQSIAVKLMNARHESKGKTH